MDLKATIAGGYRNRLILIALGTLFYSAWCIYDATIGYPKKQDIHEKYQDVQQENPSDWQEKWAEQVKEHGYPQQPDPVSTWNINTQWIQFAIVFPIGAYCLFSVVRWSRRFVAADDNTLYSHGGVEVPFDQIARIDASRWGNKGIARVYYENGAGEQMVLIDDWKYDREPSDLIFSRIRDNVDADIIEGLDDSGDAGSETESV